MEKSILFPAVAGTGGIHLLFDASLLHECLLQELKMSAHHTVRDMQGRDGSVAELLVRPAVESLPRSVSGMSTPTLPPPIRTTITLLLAWGVVIFGCHISEVKDVSRNTWVFLILSGLSTGLSWLFYFKAIQLGDVSRVVPIDKLSVVITILLAFLFLHEQPSLKVVIGAVLIAAGSIFMIL